MEGTISSCGAAGQGAQIHDCHGDEEK